MSSSKPSKRKGRPPKYVRDSRGREIVGLSYHKAVGQYYLTFSDPRVYLGNDKNKAVETFCRQREYEKLSPEAQEEAKRKDEIYQKALELLDYDECIQKHIFQKARAELDKIFLQEAQYVMDVDPIIRKAMRKNLSRRSVYQTKFFFSTYLYERFAPEEVKDRIHYKSDPDVSLDTVTDFIGEMIFNHVLSHTMHDYLKSRIFPESINHAVKELVDERIREEAEKLFDSDKDSLVCERAYDLILKNPIKAAMKIGIKELAYLALCPPDVDWHNIRPDYRLYPMPLPWWLGWKIYKTSRTRSTDNKDLMSLEQKEYVWRSTGIFVGVSRNIDTITRTEINNAICFNYSSMDSLENEYDPYEWKEAKAEINRLGSFPPISRENRLKALTAVSSQVLKLGYQQCSTLCDILKDMH
jgi:hypothetical protein